MIADILRGYLTTMFNKKHKIRTALLCVLTLAAVAAGAGCGSVDLTMDGRSSNAQGSAQTAVSVVKPVQTTAETTTAVTTTTVATTAVPEPEPVYGDDFVGSRAAICYDLTEEKIIYSKNADELVYPASTTKLLTALTAIEYTSPEYIYYVGSELELVAKDSSMSWISQGSSLCRNAILTAMLAPSGNDAAYTIAVNVARKVYGSDISDREAVDYFAVLMNDYAKKLGAENTHFTVPDGYHDDNHYTTASDMLKFAIAATKSSTICDITCQPLAIVYDEEGGVHSWDNGNKLLTDTTIPYEVYGFKTGFTDEAGFCFIGYAGMDGKKIITLTYGGDVEYRFADTKKLMDLGFDMYDENYDYYSVAE